MQNKKLEELLEWLAPEFESVKAKVCELMDKPDLSITENFLQAVLDILPEEALRYANIEFDCKKRYRLYAHTFGSVCGDTPEECLHKLKAMIDCGIKATDNFRHIPSGTTHVSQGFLLGCIRSAEGNFEPGECEPYTPQKESEQTFLNPDEAHEEAINDLGDGPMDYEDDFNPGLEDIEEPQGIQEQYDASEDETKN